MLQYFKNEILSNFKPSVTPLTISDIRDQEDRAFLKESKETLDQLEKIRLQKLEVFEFRKKIGLWTSPIIISACGYIDYLLLIWQSGDDEFVGITAIALGLLYTWVTQPKRQYIRRYKQDILPKIAKLFGDFTYSLKQKISMAAMRPSKIVPSHDRYSSEDYFTGIYNGIKIEFSEIHLEERRRNNKRTYYVTIFKGLAIMLDTNHKRFYGHTIIDKNKNRIGEWFKEKSSSLERAEMVDPEFEEIFDAFTNDQVEARYLIDPIMIERLKALYKEYDGNKMAVAFYEEKMLILIGSNHNHFEPASIYTPATSPESILNMKREIGQTLAIIDKLSLYDPDKVHRDAETELTSNQNLGSITTEKG